MNKCRLQEHADAALMTATRSQADPGFFIQIDQLLTLRNGAAATFHAMALGDVKVCNDAVQQ
jgi:hypothetical protein